MTWWHNLTLRSMLAGSFTLMLVLTSGLMGSGACWLFCQSSSASASQARIQTVEAMWENRPGHGGPDAPPLPPGPPPGFGHPGAHWGLPQPPGRKPGPFEPVASALSHPDDGLPPATGFHRWRGDFEDWAPFFAHWLHITNQQVMVWNDDGQLLATVGTGPLVAPPAPDVLQMTAARRAPDMWTHADRDFLLIPLRDGEHTRYVELVNPRNAPDPNLHQLERFLLLSGAGALLLGAIVGGVLARLLSSPLEKLSLTTAQAATGALTVRTQLPRGHNEVLQVAQAFDGMLGQVAETFDAQRRFVADASHELRTPLTTISGLAEVLEQDGDALTAERRTRSIYLIAREVTRMNRLISDLLLLSKADEAGVVQAEPLRIQPILVEHVERVQVTFPPRVLTWDCDDTVAIPWDEQHFSRVLGNLMDNAAKYSSDGAAIHVTARRLGDHVEIQVSDSGSGIAADDLPHVFERFYRADRSRNRRTGGSGLGLALVKALVHGYGASIHIESELGRGTTVTLLTMAAVV